MNPYSRLIPRLNGKEIEERFDYYLRLVKKGVAGFIVFGGGLDPVRLGIERLQDASAHPLIIASDLEQGLGQQIEGGTVFPPAMAIASAVKNLQPPADSPKLLEDTFEAFALEARYAGINAILAPVLDINTNPDNPIIATRAFGEDKETVSYFGCEMVKVLRRNGIITCGKHFPGHGDTEIDSHISLPVINKDISSIEETELMPFRTAIREGVDMIMLGHLSVPALDPSGIPVSISQKSVSYLRETMKFKGVLITDAMNMGGLGGYTENKASLVALESGVDIILHPTDPDDVASYLARRNEFVDTTGFSLFPDLGSHTSHVASEEIDFRGHQRLSDKLAEMAVVVEGSNGPKMKNPYTICLDDEKTGKGESFIDSMEQKFPGAGYCSVFPEDEIPWSAIPENRDLVVAVFSSVRAWKGRGEWLREAIESLNVRARIFVSFGNPYVLRNIRGAMKIYAYWDSLAAIKAVIGKLGSLQ